MLEFVKDNIILVIPNTIKKDVLLWLNESENIYDIKLISLDELISKLTFSYDEKTIYYLMNKYNIKYDVATVYLKNIKYIEDKEYKNSKLNFLKGLKNELNENNLLYFDENIDSFLKNREIIVYGYDYIDKYSLNILSRVNAKIIEEERNNYTHDIYEFNDIEDEVEFIASQISSLISNNVDINKIKIIGYSDEYYNAFKRIFKFYNIPIIINDKGILDTAIVNYFLNIIKENDVDKTLEMIKDKYDLSNEKNNYIYNRLINVLNKYTFIDNYNDITDILIHDFKKEKCMNDELSNYVKITDIKDNIFHDDEYVFLVGFNQGSIPIIYKDEDYISDSIKSEVLLETTKEKNIKEKETILNIIRSIKNLIVTYKLKSPFEVYYKSPLSEEECFNVIKNKKIENKYSNKSNQIRLSKYLDNLVKFGVKEEDLDLLYSNYKDIKYMKFNNKYKMIEKDKLLKKLNNNLLLSYSSIDNYFRCSFRYYLNNILKLTDYEETFYIKIGNIFHEILSKCFNDNFNFEEEYNLLTKDIKSSNKDKFFIEKLKEELLFIIDTIKFQNKFSSFDEALYENKIYVNKEGNIKLTFMGIIDKLLLKKEDNNVYLVIIDYKTGSPNTNLNNVVYGIDMQLPIYVYLSSKKIEGSKVVGFYLQKILDNKLTRQRGKTLEKIKKDNLKLQGYSIDNEELISKFDSSYKDSEVIKSLKVGNNGFYAYSKIINEENIEKLVRITEKNIDKAFNEILDCNFDINPKRIGNNLVGCEFCKYKDICFMKEEDIVNLEEYKNLEFLK